MSATSFLSGEHRPYAVGEIQANLSLLGFGAEDSSSDSAATKILADDGLFAHSDHNAFQQVGLSPKFGLNPNIMSYMSCFFPLAGAY